MTLKTLVTGVAAAAVVGGMAAGVTCVASPASSTAPAVQPVAWEIPMPQAPAPDLQTPLIQTLQALAGGGSFAGKAPYIEGGIGRIESIAADRAYNRAAAEGKFPLSFKMANIEEDGGVANADVTAISALGTSATQNVRFVAAGASPTGWQISKDSALSLLSAAG